MKKYLFTYRRLFVASIILVLSCLDSMANIEPGTWTYHIKAGVKVKEGEGKVYISDKKMTPETYYEQHEATPETQENVDEDNYTQFQVRKPYYYYAQPSEGYFFDHWEDNSGNFLSNENPMNWYVLRQESDGTQNYYAVFKNSQPEEYDQYYRVKNASSGKYLSLTGEIFNFQTVIGSASKATVASVINNANLFIKKDIILTEDNYQSTTSTVFSLRKVSEDYSDVVCQGISLKNFTTGIFHGTNAGDRFITNHGVMTELGNNGYVKVKMDMDCEKFFQLETYLYTITENGKEVVVVGDESVKNSEKSDWILEPLTEESMETSYFGAAPLAKVTDGNKFYTTMYTAFPYKLKDGVKAYYVKAVNNSRAQCVEIKDVVPAYTAVILECNSTEPKENRLVPSPRQVNSVVTPEENMLKGVIDIDNGSTATSSTPEANYRTANDQSTMRVLNVNAKGVLGFYKYGGIFMNSNKAYLDVSNVADAKSFTLQFVEGETTGISEVRTLDKSNIRDGHYYDLQGRRVENPSHGLYITNGKKVYIK